MKNIFPRIFKDAPRDSCAQVPIIPLEIFIQKLTRIPNWGSRIYTPPVWNPGALVNPNQTLWAGEFSEKPPEKGAPKKDLFKKILGQQGGEICGEGTPFSQEGNFWPGRKSF